MENKIIVANNQLPFTQEELKSVLAYNVTPSTIKVYQRDSNAYKQYADANNLDIMSYQTFIAWRDDLIINTNWSPKTINRMLSAVKRIMKEARERGIISITTEEEFNHVSGIGKNALKDRKKQNSRTRISREQMRKICELPDSTTIIGLRDRAILSTLASSGLRISELSTLKMQQIRKVESNYIISVVGKTDNEPRDVYLSREAFSYIEAWIKARAIESEYIFTSFNSIVKIQLEKNISSPGLWGIVKKYSEKAGIYDVKPHDFRRFVGTQIAARYDIRKAQKALGHKSIDTTARNYVLDDLEAGLTNDLY